MAIREHGLFRALDHPAPDAAQGGCYISHDTGPCVDTGVLVYGEGTLTLSSTTIRELAEVAGFTVIDGLVLEADLAHAQYHVERLTIERDDLRAQLDAVGLAVAHAATNMQARANQ